MTMKYINKIHHRTKKHKSDSMNLNILENPLTHSYKPDLNPRFRQDGTQIPQGPLKVNYLPTVSTDVNAVISIADRMKVGGDKCDCCGKQNVKLSTCARCKMAYYCSQECQKTRWKDGHNKACRKPGQIMVGDYVKLEVYPVGLN